MSGDADVDHIGDGTRYLLATPSGGAFVLAGLGADSLPEVLDAPTGEALFIGIALVEEATLAGEATGLKCVRYVWGIEVEFIGGPPKILLNYIVGTYNVG